jgi:hypothetical protein
MNNPAPYVAGFQQSGAFMLMASRLNVTAMPMLLRCRRLSQWATIVLQSPSLLFFDVTTVTLVNTSLNAAG